MVILNAFLLKFGALLWSELVVFLARIGARGTKLMIGQERFTTVRPRPVRATGQFHLQNAEIDPQLQFLTAVHSEDLAHFDGAILVRPILQNAIQIQAHPEQMIGHLLFNCQSWRVDAREQGCGGDHKSAVSRTFHWSLITYDS